MNLSYEFLKTLEMHSTHEKTWFTYEELQAWNTALPACDTILRSVPESLYVCDYYSKPRLFSITPEGVRYVAELRVADKRERINRMLAIIAIMISIGSLLVSLSQIAPH